jgi:hypothetical protein
MAMVINGTSGLTFNNSTTQQSAATVLQVVYANTGTQFTTTSSSPVDIGLSASITPKFSSSKILVLVDLNAIFVNEVASAFGYSLLYKGAVSLGQFGYIIGYTSAAITRSGTSSFSYLDSPATTSATTYGVKGAVANGGTINYQRDNQGISTITLMEIAG